MTDQKSNIMNIVKDYSLQEKITSCVFYSKVINQIKIIRDMALKLFFNCLIILLQQQYSHLGHVMENDIEKSAQRRCVLPIYGL